MRKKVGLCLGAGGSRGFAHIGAIQVLLENKIPIDCVTGCSMGSIIGGLFASGTDMYFLEKYALKFDMARYLDLSIRTGGFVRGKKVSALIRLLTKGIDIRQTKLPFACVAVEICTGACKTFTEGPLYEAIRASISIPGVFEPFKMKDGIYIDGGVLERLPINAARQIGADTVIAVDVAERGQRQEPPRNVIDTLRMTMAITDWKFSQENEKSADLLITPDVFEVDSFSNKQPELCVRRGREAAEAAIPAIRALLEREGCL